MSKLFSKPKFSHPSLTCISEINNLTHITIYETQHPKNSSRKTDPRNTKNSPENAVVHGLPKQTCAQYMGVEMTKWGQKRQTIAPDIILHFLYGTSQMSHGIIRHLTFYQNHSGFFQSNARHKCSLTAVSRRRCDVKIF